MAGSIVAAAKALADQLTAAGVRATHDPAKAHNMRPCVLVPPPSVDYVERTNTWRLAALAGHGAGTLDALDQLDQLVVDVVAQLPVESAEPGAYRINPAEGEAIPAYFLTVTT